MKYTKRLITQTPECLTEPVGQSLNVIISTLFALVFLTAYVPFSGTAWFQVGKGSYFFTTLAFVGTGTLFLALSRTFMTWLVRKMRHFPFWLYILWLFLEIVLIAVYYTLLSYFQIQTTEAMGHSFAFILAKSFLVTLVALGVPYTVTDLVILLKDTQQRLMQCVLPTQRHHRQLSAPLQDADHRRQLRGFQLVDALPPLLYRQYKKGECAP